MAPLPAPLQRSNSPSPSTVSPLSSLPAEVLLQIASRLDFAALARYRRTSSACNAFVEASSELIYRRLCFSQGLLEERTCAATGLKPCLYGIESLADAFDAGELGRAVAAQRSMSGYYEGVEEWKELARRRLCLDRNWLAGVCEEGWTALDLQGCEELVAGIWRFKLDVEAGNFVTSGVHGGTQAFGRNGHRRWETWLSNSVYPHVELSEGYFIILKFENNHEVFIVWRRDDIILPPSPLSQSTIDFHLNSAVSYDPSVSYVPYWTFCAPSRCTATKARWPLFAAAAPQRQEAYIWNLETAQLQSTIDFSGTNEPHLRYLDLDEQHIFIVGKDLISTWDHRGALASVFPPEAVIARSLRFTTAEGWTALHHDARGGSLVAVTADGMLVWTCRHRQIVSTGSQALAEDSWVILQMEGKIVQLSVENERAVFVTEELNGSSTLWLLHLRPFASLNEFKSSPPSPIRIASPLPCFETPCRIEQTSDQIFLPSHTSFALGGANYDRLVRLRQVVEAVPIVFAWRSFSGFLIGGSQVPTWGGQAMRDWRWRDKVADAICTYSFGSLE